jgi:beta-lactamase class A
MMAQAGMMPKPLGAIVVALTLCLPAVAQTAAEPPLQADQHLQAQTEQIVKKLNLSRARSEGRLAMSLVDITDPSRPRYAGVNDRQMMYAASLPKIAVLVAGFERIRAGLLDYTPAIKEMFIRMTRFSSNIDASKAIHKIGFDYIAQVLTSPKYLFYDPQQNGGLWLGKAYGGPDDYWRRDPLHNISHGATSLQVARFFVMLEQGRLVSPEYSAEIKQILSNPGIHHKFVKGLESKPGCQIYRKSGTWYSWHSDAALVEHNGKKYIAVALMQDSQGGEIFPKLIVQVDDLMCSEEAPAPATEN